jgi:hypothetical protein
MAERRCFASLEEGPVTEGTSNIRIAPLAFSMKAILVVGILMRSTRLCWSVIWYVLWRLPLFLRFDVGSVSFRVRL